METQHDRAVLGSVYFACDSDRGVEVLPDTLGPGPACISLRSESILIILAGLALDA